MSRLVAGGLSNWVSLAFNVRKSLSRGFHGDPITKAIKRPKGSVEPGRVLRRSQVPKRNGRSKSLDSFGSTGQIFSSVLEVRPCTTITTAESYDLPKLIDELRKSGLRPVSLIPDEIVSFSYLFEGQLADIMVLGNSGTVVSWGLEEKPVMEVILPILADSRIKPIAEDQFESEDMDYAEFDSNHALHDVAQALNKVEDASFIIDDLIVINSLDSESGMLDKAAFACGMSRSTRLAFLENSLEKRIEKTRKFTELLSQGKKLNITESDVLRSTGSLFLLRGKLNLYSELIETPDLYWSEPQLENIYKEISKSLDIQPRIAILNAKLDYATDESRALMAVLNEKKSTRLEWIIIYLILIEVCFELHHYYERYLAEETRGK
ncbi:LAMI_0D03774g1_1 [Lachancea mirantina]|uniref:LAMI_0D03774g1_1 n=1 Tax=Lachancea mirantina TaxID=1230905 RepID=A0A1G4JA86_9SACH|nr:LAMI_0D03774g1_1 [Lachancea mirantina]